MSMTTTNLSDWQLAVVPVELRQGIGAGAVEEVASRQATARCAAYRAQVREG